MRIRTQKSVPRGTVPAVGSTLVAVAALALYAALTPGVSGDGDSSELTLVLATLGVAHPTGYPLYTLAGHAFVTALHALGVGQARAANLWSGLGAAVAVGLFHALATRLVPSGLGPRTRAGLALLPTALFALNPLWTVEATLAEVYSWHLAWLCGAGLLYAAALEAMETHPQRLGRLAVGWGLLGGVGAAHHATSVLAWLALGAALVLQLRARRLPMVRLLAAAALAALVPLVADGYVLWRAFHPAEVQWPTLQPSLDSALAHLSGRIYRHYLGGFEPSAVQSELLARYLWPVLVPALLVLAGVCVRARGGDRWMYGGLAAAALVLLAYALSYRVPDPSSFLLGPLMLALLAVAPLAGALWTRPPGRAVVGAAGLAMMLLGASWGRVAVERRHLFESFDARVRDMWRSIPFERAIVLFPDDMHFKLREYQVLEGDKPGLDVISTTLLLNDGPRERFRARYGFDALEGLEDAGRQHRASFVLGEPAPEQARLTALIHENIAARAPVPVIGFDPQHRSVRLFRGTAPGAPARSGPARGTQ